MFGVFVHERMGKKAVQGRKGMTHPTHTLQQVVMLENSGELFQHLQVSQVTSDLGGTIRFNHQEWIDAQRVGILYSKLTYPLY